MKSTKARSSKYTVKGTSIQALPVTPTIRRSAATPTSFVDPDNFQKAVAVLLQARAQLLDAADRADFASSKAGTVSVAVIPQGCVGVFPQWFLV
jgi:hypothetical protein